MKTEKLWCYKFDNNYVILIYDWECELKTIDIFSHFDNSNL